MNLIIKKHPYAESLNKKLLKDAERLLEELAPFPSMDLQMLMGKRTSIQIYDISSNVQNISKLDFR